MIKGAARPLQAADKPCRRLFDESDNLPSLIPAVVAGIQRPDVRRIKKLFQLNDLS